MRRPSLLHSARMLLLSLSALLFWALLVVLFRWLFATPPAAADFDLTYWFVTI